MKKLLNQPEHLIDEMGAGIALTYPNLNFNQRFHFFVTRALNPDHVTIMSGGGSGHEPAHAGYIGTGMLDVAVCGDVFASPTQIQIYEAIKASQSPRGTLLIINNYSGDIMNFLNAAEMAKHDGIEVDYVKVDDDIAVQDSLYTVGRRGVAGTVFVEKTAGAAAARGASLAQVKAAAEEAIRNVKTLGFALSSCTVPAKGTQTFTLAENEMEYGVGIHGEPGIQREPIMSADELAHRMVPPLLHELAQDAPDSEATPSTTQSVAVMVNGMGSTPLMELYVFAQAVISELHRHGVSTYRLFTGNYMTSIDMLGASVTLLKMSDHLRSLLDDPSTAPAFRIDEPMGPLPTTSLSYENSTHKMSHLSHDPSSPRMSATCITRENIMFMVATMARCALENEVAFCELDSYAGDGDFGMSIASGFRELQTHWDDLVTNHSATIGDFLTACGSLIIEHCGGASGPIWGSAFYAAGSKSNNAQSLTLLEFAHLMQASVEAIQATGERSFGRGARLGDKTLIDALIPYANSLMKDARHNITCREALKNGANAAVLGARSTADMVAHMGRAGTVGQRSLGYEDAGAHALGVLFSAIAAALEPLE